MKESIIKGCLCMCFDINGNEKKFLLNVYNGILKVAKNKKLYTSFSTMEILSCLKRVIDTSVSKGILTDREYATLYSKFWNGFSDAKIASFEGISNSMIFYRVKWSILKVLNFELLKELKAFPDGAIEYVNMSKRAYNALKINGVNTVSALCDMSDDVILSKKHIGETLGREICGIKERLIHEEAK